MPYYSITETIEITASSAQGCLELSVAHAAGNPYPITSRKQFTVDITGGTGIDSTGNSHDINGGNDFTNLSTFTSTQVTYTLTFADEDHPDPDWDGFWDVWIQIRHLRTTHIETITADSNGTNFDIWDDDKTFAEFYGHHGKPSKNIFQSNIYLYQQCVESCNGCIKYFA